MMFELLKTDSHTKARLGRLTTAHGVVDTPVFMPVGTQASVKALDPRELLRDGHANHPRQHLPSQHPARPGHHPRRRRPAPVHELAQADPHRQRRLPGLQPRQNPQNQAARRRIPFAPGRLAAVSRPEGSDGNPARARLGHRHGVRRMPAARRARRASSATPSNAPSAGRANAANNRAPTARRFSASSRAAATPRCARNAPRRSSRWILTATPSAA